MSPYQVDPAIIEPPITFQLDYSGSQATYHIKWDQAGGMEMALIDRGVHAEDHIEVITGWVSVRMPLKAALDYNHDLRNNAPSQAWEQGFANN